MFLRHPSPLKADHVQAADACAVALHDDEWGHASLACGAGRNERALPHPHELRYAALAAERDPIFDRGVAGELRPIGQNAMGADHDVVRNVRAHHEQIAVADGGVSPFRPAMDGDVLAKDVSVTDFETRRGAAGMPRRLRLSAYHGEGVDDGARADDRGTADEGMGMQNAARREDGVALDHRVRPDDDVVGKLRARVDDRAPMDSRHGYMVRATTLARSSALAQSVPSTDASPWNFQTFVR